MKQVNKPALATVLALSIGLFTVSHADDAEALVPAAEYPKLVARSTKVLQDALGSSTIDKKTAGKARAAAVLIAAYAQYAPGAADQRALLRDAALKIAELIKDEEFLKDTKKQEAARKQADGLAEIKAEPAAKPGPVVFMDKLVEIDEIMSPYRLPRVGGLGLESSLLKLGSAGLKTRSLPPANLDEALVLTAYQTAVTARLTKDHKVDGGDKAQARWGSLSQEMEKAALDLAAAAKGQNGMEAYTALNKLNASCNKCHEEFRDNK